MTRRRPFSSAVVLVATSMNDSEERSDEESGAGFSCFRSLDSLPRIPRGAYPELSRKARGDKLQSVL